MKMFMYLYDVLIKYLLEMAYCLIMPCDKMRKRHFNDKVNATRTHKKRKKRRGRQNEDQETQPIS